MLISPSALGVHVFAVVAATVCLVAGSWQHDAYQHEQAAERADRSGAAPVPVADLLDPDEPLRADAIGRRVLATGTYAPATEQLLVSGREHDGRQGWWVLSPLLVEDDTALLVVRGWTDEPLAPPVPSGPVTVTASVQPGEDAGTVTSPVAGVVDSVRLPSLVNSMPYRLYPAYGIRTEQEPPPADALQTVTAVAPDPSWTTGAKNLAYALQWWAFAAFAVFMWWRVLADRMRPKRSTALPPESAGDTP